MIQGNINFSFPANREHGIFLRMAVSGAAAAYDLPLDMLEDLRAASDEALDYLLADEKRADALVLCDLYHTEDAVTMHMRVNGRSGLPVESPAGDTTRAILGTLMNDVMLFADQTGGTGVRMTLRRVK